MVGLEVVCWVWWWLRRCREAREGKTGKVGECRDEWGVEAGGGWWVVGLCLGQVSGFNAIGVVVWRSVEFVWY